jgi:tetratricopeptide (TPR) repeat protein
MEETMISDQPETEIETSPVETPPGHLAKTLLEGGKIQKFVSEIIHDFSLSHELVSAVELKNNQPNQTILLSTPLSKKEIVDNTVDENIATEFPETELVEAAFSLKDLSVFNSLDELTFYLKELFTLANRFVIILAENKFSFEFGDQTLDFKLTSWVRENMPGWSLAGFVPARFPNCSIDDEETSDDNFFIFSQGQTLTEKYRIFQGFTDVVLPPLAPGAEAALLKQARNILPTNPLEAIKPLQIVVASNPDNLVAANNLALIMYILGKTRDAEAVFKRILAEDSKIQSTRMNLAKMYIKEERWIDLRAFLPELLLLIKIDPKIDSLWPKIRNEFIKLDNRMMAKNRQQLN